MILRAVVAVLCTTVYTYGGFTVLRQKTLAIKLTRAAVSVYALTITAAMILRWHEPVNVTVWLAFAGSALAVAGCVVEWVARTGSQGTRRRSS